MTIQGLSWHFHERCGHDKGHVHRGGVERKLDLQAEIELKLELSAQAAEIFAQWPPLLTLDGETATLHATYFDTPDHRLAHQGVSLRIRRSGRRRIQTVKANGRGGAGLFARDEWERPVRGDTPVLDEGNPVAALLGDAVANFGAKFLDAASRPNGLFYPSVTTTTTPTSTPTTRVTMKKYDFLSNKIN